jgi:ABC-2 type transport system ATP-binding protein
MVSDLFPNHLPTSIGAEERRAAKAAEFAAALATERVPVQQADEVTLLLRGLPAERVGHLAFVHGIELHELSRRRADLEELFFTLTAQAMAAQPVLEGRQ